jgi:GTPase SAR1 family protein
VELLKQTREQLEELFLLVVVGEFNAGKSAFLNAMLGKKYLKEGGALTACPPPLTHVVVERCFVSSRHLNAPHTRVHSDSHNEQDHVDSVRGNGVVCASDRRARSRGHLSARGLAQGAP